VPHSDVRSLATLFSAARCCRKPHQKLDLQFACMPGSSAVHTTDSLHALLAERADLHGDRRHKPRAYQRRVCERLCRQQAQDEVQGHACTAPRRYVSMACRRDTIAIGMQPPVAAASCTRRWLVCHACCMIPAAAPGLDALSLVGAGPNRLPEFLHSGGA